MITGNISRRGEISSSESKPNRLPREHISPGNVLWYSGNTSLSGWSCPAEIIDVNEMNETFRVLSLDDCKEQRQVYTFKLNQFSPESRCSMFVPTQTEMDVWFFEQAGPMRSLRIEKTVGHDRNTEQDRMQGLPSIPYDRFVVHFEARVSHVGEWAVKRWAARNGIATTYGLDKDMETLFSFRSMEDAALCHLTFSQGMKWSMIE